MRPGHPIDSPERQVVHRLFTVRWTTGFVHTRMHGAMLDDVQTRQQIESWSAMLREVIPQLGGRFVSLIDLTALGPIPQTLWLALIELTRSVVRHPERRAVITAEGRAGDNQAETAQLVTAGGVRVFPPDQVDAAIDWLAEPGIVEPARLRRFLR